MRGLESGSHSDQGECVVCGKMLVMATRGVTAHMQAHVRRRQINPADKNILVAKTLKREYTEAKSKR